MFGSGWREKLSSLVQEVIEDAQEHQENLAKGNFNYLYEDDDEDEAEQDQQLQDEQLDEDDEFEQDEQVDRDDRVSHEQYQQQDMEGGEEVAEEPSQEVVVGKDDVGSEGSDARSSKSSVSSFERVNVDTGVQRQLQEQIRQLEEKCRNAEGKCARFGQTAEENYRQFQRALREKQSLEASMNRKIADLEQTVNDVKQSSEATKDSHLKQLEDLEAGYKKMLAERDAEMGRLRDQVEREVKKEAKRFDEVEVLKVDDESDQQKIREEQETALAEISSLRQEKDTLKSENANLKQSLERMKLDLDAKLEACKLEKNELQRRLDSMMVSFDKLQENARATFDSETGLQQKCSQYEREIDELEALLNDYKARYAKMDEERHMVKKQVENLQEELKRKTEAHKKGITTVTGQLEEIERLREQLRKASARENALKDGLSVHAGEQQQIHKLTAELAATKGDLEIAESDLARLTTERENLNTALAELNSDLERRSAIYERRIDDMRKQFRQQQQELQQLKEKSGEERTNAAIEHNKLREEIEKLRGDNQVLQKKVADLEEEERKLKMKRTSSSLSSSAMADEVIQATSNQNQSENASEGGSTTHEDDPNSTENGDNVFDKELIRKVVVSYFLRKQNGTFQSQREMLSVLANLLDMDDMERQVVGLILPKQPQDQIGDEGRVDDDGLMERKGGQTSLFKRILFGTDDNKKPDNTDWKAMEEAVTAKPFADLWEDILSKDM